MNRQYDGALNSMHRSSDVNYYPSHTKVQELRQVASQGRQMPLSQASISGKAMRRGISNENNFQQPGERYRSFDSARRERFVKRVACTLNAPRVSKQLKAIWVRYWKQCDAELGARVESLVNRSAL